MVQGFPRVATPFDSANPASAARFVSCAKANGLLHVPGGQKRIRRSVEACLTAAVLEERAASSSAVP